jgi:CRP/FNR family cyclic AMP-dependent transcriptional regulator
MDKFSLELEKFFSQFKLRTYQRGDVILHEDDTPNGTYYLKSGFVKLYSYSPDGEELIRIILGPGDLFPIRWTIDQEPIDFYLAPMSDVTCSYAPRQTFLNFISQDPKLMLNLSSYIVKRMGTLYKRMEFFAFGDAYEKITSILVFLAKRFGKQQTSGLLIELPLTQRDLGALVGVARETVNEELESLKDKGIVETENHHIIIKDLAKLEEESQLLTAI